MGRSFVFIYPVWWGSVPALLKGFIDRVFLPGFAFRKKPNSLWWDKLLKGKVCTHYLHHGSTQLVLPIDLQESEP